MKFSKNDKYTDPNMFEEVEPEVVAKAVEKFTKLMYHSPNKEVSAYTKKIKTRNGEEVKRKRLMEFRASSLPFCPIKWCFNVLENKGFGDESDCVSLGIFAGTGTQWHTVLQRFAALNGQIYGNWSRYKRVTIKNVLYLSKETETIVWNKVGPVILDGEELLYEEVIVRCPITGLTGHVDCLIPFSNGYIILDFKTSSGKKMLKLQDAGEPAEGYKHQIMAYWHLLSKYGPWNPVTKTYDKPLKIYGAVIQYLDRANPFKYEMQRDENYKGSLNFLFTEKDKGVVRWDFKGKMAADKALKTGKFKEVSKLPLCEDREQCKSCEWADKGCLNSSKVLDNLRSSYKKNKVNIKPFYKRLKNHKR